jgi:hypothetical protein
LTSIGDARARGKPVDDGWFTQCRETHALALPSVLS